MNHLVNVLLLLLHGLSAMMLLGAVTHQAVAVWLPASGPRSGWWRALHAVHPDRYARAIVVLFCITVLLGAINYIPFRVFVRAQYLDLHAPRATGLFEHAAAIGLAVLPAYWVVWGDSTETAARGIRNRTADGTGAPGKEEVAVGPQPTGLPPDSQ